MCTNDSAHLARAGGPGGVAGSGHLHKGDIQASFCKDEYEFLKCRGHVSNPQQTIEPPVLHIIKNEEKVVASNNLGIAGEERVCKIAGSVHFLCNSFI